MRVYTVQAGDSPASIAAKLAGCPKCAVDLVAANRARPTIVYPNGYETFVDLTEGDTLALPEKWFDGSLDRAASDYFLRLPSVDGRTGGALAGLPGINAVAQLGLTTANATGATGAAFTFASDTINSALPAGTGTALATGLAVAGGASHLTPAQITQYGVAAADAIAGVIVPGVGALIMQALLSAFGTATGGPGHCETPGPPPSLPSVGGSGSFETLFNGLAVAEWQHDGVCPSPNPMIGGTSSPGSYYLAWIPILATAIAAWNTATDTSGPSLQDVDGVVSIVSPTGGQLTISRTVLVPTSIVFGGQAQNTYGPKFADAIGLALNAHADLSNFTLDPSSNGFTANQDTSGWPVQPNAVISFAVHSGATHATVGPGPHGGGLPYQPPPAGASGASAKSSSRTKTAIAVGGAAAAGFGLYAFLTKQTIEGAARTLWREAKRTVTRRG